MKALWMVMFLLWPSVVFAQSMAEFAMGGSLGAGVQQDTAGCTQESQESGECLPALAETYDETIGVMGAAGANLSDQLIGQADASADEGGDAEEEGTETEPDDE